MYFELIRTYNYCRRGRHRDMINEMLLLCAYCLRLGKVLIAGQLLYNYALSLSSVLLTGCYY